MRRFRDEKLVIKKAMNCGTASAYKYGGKLGLK